MRILGISAFYHDSAAALVENGQIIAAAQEERFTRKKYDPSFPQNAVDYCLAEAGSSLADLDYIAFYDKPFLKFERLVESYLADAPRGFKSFRLAMPLWTREKLFQRRLLARAFGPAGAKFDWENRLLFTEHHHSHAASAFFPSPFTRAAILTVDGVGEWATTSAAMGHGNQLTILKEIHFPHSLGLLYSAFTYYLGFRVNSGEYKVMGLAPYGTPKYAQVIIDHLIDLKFDGSYRLNLDYFNYCTGLTMTGPAFDRFFGSPARRPDEPLTQFHMDLAASIQSVLNEVMLRLTRSLAAETGEKALCLAGGVALNCVANNRILRDRAFERIWIQPAPGDAGGAIGAALAAYYQYHGAQRPPCAASDSMKGALLGPAFDDASIEARLATAGARFTHLSDESLLERSVEALAAGKALGWFQGRMEFGPRALGARSILADPRSPAMQSVLNQKVKRRESFRPFAPAVLREFARDWFDIDCDSPYMLLTADISPQHRIALDSAQQQLQGIAKLGVARSSIPAVTHVDYSARLQTVDRETHPRFHALLSRFHAKTGCPLLVNTSFNVRGEPVVCSPEDAFCCFMSTDLNALAIGNCFLVKEEQSLTPSPSPSALLAPD